MRNIYMNAVFKKWVFFFHFYSVLSEKLETT